jgi:hypothetical protein
MNAHLVRPADPPYPRDGIHGECKEDERNGKGGVPFADLASHYGLDSIPKHPHIRHKFSTDLDLPPDYLELARSLLEVRRNRPDARKSSFLLTSIFVLPRPPCKASTRPCSSSNLLRHKGTTRTKGTTLRDFSSSITERSRTLPAIANPATRQPFLPSSTHPTSLRACPINNSPRARVLTTDSKRLPPRSIQTLLLNKQTLVSLLRIIPTRTSMVLFHLPTRTRVL